MIEKKARANREVLNQLRLELVGTLEQVEFFSAGPDRRQDILRRYYDEIGPGENTDALMAQKCQESLMFAIDRVDEILKPK